ncbi:DUF6745 domain-containing protein [Nostoc sp. FACHB-280]|uniref:DUF6745 domain-containing protein n=1 Tax=Nostoc sp. FACHB-280 TaxID=2692839 RepID=UPI00168ACBF6|nr:hypothetical protein [Nostoc sp. FACHB-280]MBD2497007.1 hypothetical protein [Nostoc sp. FACHB-280]
MIETLTPEQEALIPVYRDKWRKIALSNKQIETKKATEIIKQAFADSGIINNPKIKFVSSPLNAFEDIKNLYTLQKKVTYLFFPLFVIIIPVLVCFYSLQIESDYFSGLIFVLGCVLSAITYYKLSRIIILNIDTNILDRLRLYLLNNINCYISKSLECKLSREFYDPILEQTERQLSRIHSIKLKVNLHHFRILSPIGYGWYQWRIFVQSVARCDYCISVLNCKYDFNKWQIMQSMIEEVGCIIPPYNQILLVVNRPIVLNLDSQNRLHAEGETAIRFADSYSFYSYHGVTLPERYGKLHPHQWQAKWLLEEKNTELRRVLIQGIGYSKICQELQATELDYWHEYVLLKIDAFVDVEAIYLLKMTCPSTGFIYVLRVPPYIKSAREAICWVNWDIDPEEFGMQT